MRLKNLLHYGNHSQLFIVNKNGGISMKYLGGLEPFSPPIPPPMHLMRQNQTWKWTLESNYLRVADVFEN